MSKGIGLGFFLLALAAIFAGQSTGISPILLYLAPLAVIVVLVYAYAVVLIYPFVAVVAAIAAIWFLS